MSMASNDKSNMIIIFDPLETGIAGATADDRGEGRVGNKKKSAGNCNCNLDHSHKLETFCEVHFTGLGQMY
jgi:hypothetical protein